MKEISGDLIKLAKQGKFDVIAHGCNCQKNMGAGIAKQIAKEFPENEFKDKNSNNFLGDIGYISYALDDNILTVVNCYTQIWYGKPDYKVYYFGIHKVKDSKINRYTAIRLCMKKINIEFRGKHIGLPLIGCGLAGLDWNKVKNIIENELIDCEVTVVHYNK